MTAKEIINNICRDNTYLLDEPEVKEMGSKPYTPNVRVIVVTSDDWEGIYINGELHDEGHALGEGNRFFYLLELAEKFKFERADIEEIYLDDVIMEQIGFEGNLPQKFYDIGKFIDWQKIDPNFLKCTCDRKSEKCCDSIPECPQL